LTVKIKNRKMETGSYRRWKLKKLEDKEVGR
jgi:hypothetical protein